MKCENPIKIGKKWVQMSKVYLSLKMQGVNIIDEKYKKAYENVKKYPNGLYVPCNKCRNCRNRVKMQYIFRFIHETKNYKKNYFITLTYNNDNLPKGYSLKKKDATDYLKRVREKLRKIDIKEEGKNNRLDYKYFLAGEYGDKTQRPHYHVVLATNNEENAEIFKKEWKKGIVDFQEGYDKIKSVFYTIGYVEKKQGTDNKDGRERPFRKFSRGLGKEYAIKNNQTLQHNGIIYQGVKYGIPKYYRNIWEKEKITDDEYKDKLHKEYIKNRNKEIKELYEKYNDDYHQYEHDAVEDDLIELSTGELAWKYEKQYREDIANTIRNENKHKEFNRKKRSKV